MSNTRQWSQITWMQPIQAVVLNCLCQYWIIHELIAVDGWFSTSRCCIELPWHTCSIVWRPADHECLAGRKIFEARHQWEEPRGDFDVWQALYQPYPPPWKGVWQSHKPIKKSDPFACEQYCLNWVHRQPWVQVVLSAVLHLFCC